MNEKPNGLRASAEAKAIASEDFLKVPQSPLEIRALLHDLRVHQIELEMQNEELRRAQLDLEISQARYFDLYDLAPVGYVTVSQKGLILEANLTAATLFGAVRSALAEKLLATFILTEDRDICYHLNNRLFKTAKPQTCDLRIKGKDGTPFWARLEAAIAKNEAGEPVMRVVISDITGQKQAEEEHLKYERQLQMNRKLESIGLLAGGIAHEFNNLMGGIFGYIEMAIDEPDRIKAARALSKAMATMERAQGLTAKLLTFAKGGGPIQKNGPLFPCVQEAALFNLSGSNAVCRFDVPEDLWPCNFDSKQIGQVVANIIINARQAMPSGGTIEVSAENIVINNQEHAGLVNGDYVKISFKDCGVGIPREKLPHIFDPFYSTKAQGHGLGLATCFSIVNQHGGAIDVESEPGKGSSFHIYLPASTEPAPSAPGKSARKHNGSGTILVMDDEEVIRETIQAMLETLGYTAVCKENGKEAVDFFASETREKRTLAGMIFDLTVPGGMGGKAAVEKIRKLNSEIPVFVASGYAEDPVMKNPTEYGFTASICKPFRKGELLEMLNKHLGKTANEVIL